MTELPGSGPSIEGPLLRRRLDQSLRWLREGRADLAAPLLTRLHTQDPDNIQTHQSAAIAVLRDGQAAAALEMFDALLARHPQNAQALQGRGLCLHGLGQRLHALDAFRQAVISNPLAWQAWQSIADITPFEDDRIHALEGAADALLLLSASEETLPRRLASASTALAEARQPARASEFLARRGAAGADNQVLIRAYARSLYHQGDFARALAAALRLMARATPFVDSSLPAPRFEPVRAVAVLEEIQSLLHSAGARSFLAAGTLLGFHRNAAPLRHDRDIDIGILREPDGGPDIAGMLRAHPHILLPRMSRPGDRYFGFTHRGVAVDLFLHDQKDDHLLCGMSTRRGDIQWRFRRFEPATRHYGGRDWSVPADPERYLAETYGACWETPDTGFASVVSSPALFETDDDARSYYAVMRACRYASSGDVAKALSLLTQAPHPIPPPADWGDGRAGP